MLLNVSLITPFCCCVVFHLISTSVSLYSVIGEDLGCLQVLAVINIAVIHVPVIGKTDAKAETPILWSPDARS